MPLWNKTPQKTFMTRSGFIPELTWPVVFLVTWPSSLLSMACISSHPRMISTRSCSSSSITWTRYSSWARRAWTSSRCTRMNKTKKLSSLSRTSRIGKTSFRFNLRTSASAATSMRKSLKSRTISMISMTMTTGERKTLKRLDSQNYCSTTQIGGSYLNDWHRLYAWNQWN